MQPILRPDSESAIGWANLAIAIIAGTIANWTGVLYAGLEPETSWGPWAYVAAAWMTSALAFAWWAPGNQRKVGLALGALASTAWLAYMLRFEFPPNLLGHALAAVLFALAAYRAGEAGSPSQKEIQVLRRVLSWLFVGFAAAAAGFTLIALGDWLARDRMDIGLWVYVALVWAGVAVASLTIRRRHVGLLALFVGLQAILAIEAFIRFVDPNIFFHGLAALVAILWAWVGQAGLHWRTIAGRPN